MEMTKKDMLVQKIQESVNEDQAFYAAFISAPDATALQTVLKEHGFEFTVEQIDEMFRTGAAEIMRHTGDELSADELDDVAGGGFFKGTARLIASCAVGFGYGALCGVCPGAYAYAGYVATGLAVWTASGYKK